MITPKRIVRIATRQSKLALWQTQMVANRLCAAHADIHVELLPMKTEGDRRLDDSLAKIGGKGLFIKELEVAMLEGRADLAVHSMKDLPAQMPDGFCVAAILAREDPRDALLTHNDIPLAQLAQGARVGTSSLRRHTQLKHLRKDLKIDPLRGNVDTRLRKLLDGDYDAIVLAAAGLKRLGLSEHISEYLDVKICLPASSQGAVGVECRDDDKKLQQLLAVLHDTPSALAVTAERAFCLALGADCTSPVAAYAQLNNGNLSMQARIMSPDGHTMLDDHLSESCDDPNRTGRTLAENLLARGGAKLLGL